MASGLGRLGCRAVLLRPLLICGWALAGNAALAQPTEDAPPATARLLQTRLSISQSLTDNVNLSAQNKDAALITTVAPGIHMRSHGGRVRGSLDYALNGVIYSKSEQSNRLLHALTALGTVELLDDLLFVDVQGAMYQQALSAFGLSSSDPTLSEANNTQVASLRVSPRLNGRLGGLMGYTAKADVGAARAKDTDAGDTHYHGASLQFYGLGSALLNWSTSLSTRYDEPRVGRQTQSSALTASLLLRPGGELSLALVGGQERDDYITSQREASATYGGNLSWTPTPRTKLQLDWMRHGYGDTHALSLEHRFPRSALRFSDSQSYSNGNPQGAAGQPSNYDLFYLQFSSQEPDPVKRDQLVRDFLRAVGLNANAPATGGFLSAAARLVRRQDFSFSLQGVRSTLTLLLNQDRNRRLALPGSALPPSSGDLASSSEILQRGVTLSLAHRLTPVSSANLILSLLRSEGDQSAQSTELQTLAANWSTRLGRYSSVQLGLRHSRFTSATQPYRENALLASLVHQF